MAEDNPFRFANSILFTKEYLMNSEEDERSYVPFLINRALSYHLDCIFYVYEIAKQPNMPNKWAYDYYFHSIKKMKRKFTKWPKKEKDETVQLLMQYYQVNRKRAEEYKALLDNAQIVLIMNEMEKGGI